MVLDGLVSAPLRVSASMRRQFSKDEFWNWSTLVERHRFLLTALGVLAFLCTIYLYFAVTLGPPIRVPG
ncbi:putative Membrane protein PB1A10.07c [Hibiscus syriacus]|uniref:Membrane protein PB1A10.07c n=1 Tax=Hibiscus syriacus TaxID=106335 RepID=A0A6A3ATG3_HIBSY|nr:putative Membrane protein PB1A10.07c [Hibiscus syriacus]